MRKVKSNLHKFKAPLLFAMAMIPFAAVGGYFTLTYQLDLLDSVVLETAIAQVGSMEMVMLITVIQTISYALFCGFFGYILAQKTGLMKPIRFAAPALVRTLLISIAGGMVFSLDYWTFGAWIPGIREAVMTGVTLDALIASILYGGVIEEVMLRLFMMSLIAWIVWKMFFRKYESAPTSVIITANVIAALLFAAGHLPATVMTFGSLTAPILLRCFLLNGGFGLLFGWLYRRDGIQYAMVSHMIFHIVSKLIWFLFV